VFWDFDPVGVGPPGGCEREAGGTVCVIDTYITYVDRLRLAELIGRQRGRHGPVEELERALLRVAPSDPGDVPADAVTMNSVVRLRDLRSGEVVTWTLVYPGDEAGAAATSVSVLSPMGAAMLGRRCGDVICWSEGGEGRTARIEGVPYQPEASGDAR
jgi:regulator of nucleoside diphosphate kinase